MRSKLLIQILCCFLLGSLRMTASIDYGLHFKSHSVPGNERTSLSLNENTPFRVKNEFNIDFQMLVRDEPDFGAILHLCINEKQSLNFVLAAGEDNRNFPALVFNENMFAINADIKKEKWIPVSLHLNIRENQIRWKYDNKDTTLMVPLQGTQGIAVSFGKMPYFSTDVAPIDIRDIKVTRDGKLIRHWKLRKHNGDVCLDEIEGAVALAVYPSWLIDNHIEWRKIYAERTSERLDVTFNAREALFYLVRKDKIDIIDGISGDRDGAPIRGGYPVMEYIDHMIYDTLTNRLFSYSLHEKKVSTLSVCAGKWSLNEKHLGEPRYYNHARTFNPADSSFYFWGGYGFYQYRSNLYRLKVGTDQVEEVAYSPVISPRYSSAAAIVGDELYVFGGRGNKLGKQEFGTSFYYELCAINLKTGESRTVWKRQQNKDILLMASSMYFEPSDSSFYAVSMKNGGSLWKVFMNDSVWVEVSKPIYNELVYQDCDFSFYLSPAYHKLFLVLDKVLSDRTHDVAIYSINMPLLNDNEIAQAVTETSDSRWLWGLCGIILLLGGTGIFFYWIRRNRKEAEAEDVEGDDIPVSPDSEAPIEEVAEETAEETVGAAEEMVEVANVTETEKFFDRSRSAISLLGTFDVRDKEGNDITRAFTSKVKSLLILLVLYSEKNKQGILAKKTTDILWPDREEEAARNNRNVTLRKLRILLEKVGDVEIVTDRGFFSIRWGSEVFCDYRMALECIRQFKENGEHGDDKLLNQILELLLYGPLLSNTIIDWLDEFKDAYSSMSIDLLRNLLDVQRNNYDTVLRIADILFLHDPLNEEALAAKCSILFKQGKKGIAKSVYDRFCKEYRDLLGEEYKVPLYNLYK